MTEGGSTMQDTLTETSESLHHALSATLALTFGVDAVSVYAYHTGGGVMVCIIDLSQDGRLLGRQAWLTREEDWILGFYDFGADEEDEGVCVSLMTPLARRDNPFYVAAQVAGILSRLGVTLQ